MRSYPELQVEEVAVAQAPLAFPRRPRIGEHAVPAVDAASRADLLDKSELIGGVLRTRTNVKPLFVSIGHKISLAEAEEWVLRCCRGYRLPEPTRLAMKRRGEGGKARCRGERRSLCSSVII